MSDVEYDEKGHPYLHGYPSFCPLCLEPTVRVRTSPGLCECHWHCVNPRCMTEWRVGDLIDAIEQEVEDAMP